MKRMIYSFRVLFKILLITCHQTFLIAQKPVLTTNIGHTDFVTSVAVSSDDLYIISGSNDKTVKLWDRSTGNLIRTFTGHTDIINQVIFSADDKFIISCSDDQTIRLWDVLTGNEIRTFKGHTGPVKAVDISSDNRYVVSGGIGDSIILWEVETGKVVRSFKWSWSLPDWYTQIGDTADTETMSSEVLSVNFSSDNGRILSKDCGFGIPGYHDTIRIWDASTGRIVQKLSDENFNQGGPAKFCSDDNTIVSGFSGITVWDAESGEIINTAYGNGLYDVSRDGRYAVIIADGFIKLIDVLSNYELKRICYAESPYINSVLFSSDGKYIITGCGDYTVKLYDLDAINDFTLPDIIISPESVMDDYYNYSFYNPPIVPACFAMSPDGKYIITGTPKGLIKIWNTETRQQILQFTEHNKGTFAVGITSDNQFFLSGGGDHLIRLRDLETGDEIRTFSGHSGRISSLAISSDDRYLVSGSWDSKINLWDLSTGSLIHSFTGHYDKITSVDISPDNQYILSGSEDKTFKIWNISDGALVFTCDNMPDKITSLAYSSDNKYIITCDQSSDIKIWDAGNYSLVNSFTGNSFGLSSDNRYFAVGGKEGSINIYSLDDGNKLPIFNNTLNLTQFLYSLPVEAIAFSPDNNWVVSYSFDGIRFWDLRNRYLPFIIGERHINQIRSIDVSNDGRYLAVGSDNIDGLPGIEEAVVKSIDLVYSTEVKRLYKHEYPAAIVHSVVISNDGKYLAAGLSGSGILYDLDQHKVINVVDNSSEIAVESLSFSHDGDFLAIGGGMKIKILDIKQNEIYTLFEKQWSGERNPLVERVLSVRFSPDDKFILGSTHDGEIRMWDFRTGEEVLFIKDTLDDQIYTCVLSPDNNYIFAGHFHWENKSPIKKWDVNSGDLISVLHGHTNGVLHSVLTKDNRHLISASTDYTARLWDIISGNELIKFSGHTGAVTSVSLSPDDKYLFSGSYDGSVKLWDVDNGNELATLYLIDSTDWLLSTPQGLFDASPGGMKYMYFVQGMEIIELNQLKDRYYEPGLMQKLVGYNDEPLRDVTRLDQLDLYPEISVNQPMEDDGELKISLVNRGGGIGKVKILINGKEIASDARGPDVDPDEDQMLITRNISDHPYLQPGTDNIIEVKAYNKEGYLVSRGVKVHYTLQTTGTEDIPDLYIVSTGVSDYSGSDIDLRYAAKDAEDIARALEIGAKRLFGSDNTYIYLLTTGQSEKNLQPTKENITNTFEKIARTATSNDILIVYLSGHGINWGGQDGDFYYLTKEAYTSSADAYTDPAIREFSAISSQEMVELIKKIPALKQVLIIDACASGRVVENLMAQRNISSSTLRALERMKDRTGMHIITGCTADAVSYEASRYGQGILTYSLLEGMKGTALRNDRFVDINLLFQNARERVPELAGGIGGIQKPEIFSPWGAESFDIGELTSEDRQHIPLARIKPVFVRTNFQDELEYEDVLELSSMMDQTLNEWSSKGGDPALIFINTRDFPDACKLTGRYNQDQNNITLTLRIRCQGKDEQFTIKAKNTEQLVDKIIDEVVNNIEQSK